MKDQEIYDQIQLMIFQNTEVRTKTMDIKLNRYGKLKGGLQKQTSLKAIENGMDINQFSLVLFCFPYLTF